MNIIILTHQKTKPGGVERLSQNLGEYFKQSGHHAMVLGKEDLGKTASWIVRAAIRLKMEAPVFGYLLGRKAMRGGGDIYITNGSIGWNITNSIVINIQHGTYARAAERIDSGKNFFKYIVRKYVWGFFEGVAARRATRCVAVSEEVKESVARYYGVHDALVIHNGVDTHFFHPFDIPKKNQVIFVGRFEIAKGRVLMEKLRDYLETKRWTLFVAETLTSEALLRAYNESRIFLLPSMQEGNSYALLEAMSCGIPFLASPVGLVPEFEKQGVFKECVVREQTVDAYIHTFERLLSKSEPQWSSLSTSIRDYCVAHYDIERCNRAYTDLINSLV
jgi:glycosyltransferase involved in cell wall biosynthesis